MNTCPHCNELEITFWRKQRLGPLGVAICRACGKKVSVPMSAMLTTIPLIVALPIGLFAVKWWPLKILVVIIGFLIMSFVYHKYVPLTPVGSKNTEPISV